MTLDEVQRVLGPESGRLNSDDADLYRFPQVHLMLRIISDKVRRIMVIYSNRSYATAEGFRAGSNPNDLIRAYGRPKHEAKVTSDGQLRYLFGFDNGLMMLTDLYKTSVLTLGIYDPNE